MMSCKPTTTPLDLSQYSLLTAVVKPTNNESLKMENIPFTESIGQLVYLYSRTHPDIAIAVNVLSRNLSGPRPIHWDAVKRTIRYLKGTI